MSGLPFAALLLCLCITAGQSQQFTITVEHSQINVPVGGDALFSVRPSSKVRSGDWSVNGILAVWWIDQTVSVDNVYKPRAELFTSNGSLLLKSVNVRDSGEYRVNMVPVSGSQTSATITLRVIGESQQFTITVEHSQINVPVGGDALFSVRPSSMVSRGDWSVNGILAVWWIDQTVSVDNVYKTRAELFTSNGSLLLKSVKVRDSGEYRVNMIPVSGSQSSATITLRVIDAELNWQLNGAHLQSGQLLILDNISVSQTGRYTCEAYNMLTMKKNSSTREIDVYEPVTGVTVVANDSTPLENLDTIALSCDASGPVQARAWFKDNQPIQENNRIFTSSGKAKLIIISVYRNDAGTYKCIASNSFSSGSGETYVQVYYGPEMIRIVPERPVVSNTVSNLTLTCFALSVPWGIYVWYNGNNLLQTGQELRLLSARMVDVGSYTCRVTNRVTNRNSNLTVHVTAEAPKTDDNITLTAGAIVGIVLGLLGMGLIGGVTGWFIARKTSGIKDPPQSKSGRKSTLDTNTVNTPQNYENFPRNEQGASHNAQDENSTYMELNLGDRSVYSDLKR
ncbi:carcinoembryonic antigen-related cell adhesion molecule 1-like isoform X3 [Mobula hypostoma]|uniref:carcinoembryonic antigen-related cell adhesion molecule 1-like isoform X3 n=1 Tax=Mobula hypostoma TaxID=723540 RepID=UPI002FC30EC2